MNSTPPPAGLPLDGKEVHSHIEVRSHQFVETWSSLQGQVIRIRAKVSNGVPRGGRPFAPLVSLDFVDSQGKKRGTVQLLFNLPAIKKEEWHNDITVSRPELWLESATIVGSAGE